MSNFTEYIDINDEVLNALQYQKPIVALESTIISHGMPYPDNIKTAMEVEDIVLQNGAVPATIAIIKGRIKIGLNPDELEFLASSNNVSKVSRRDIPYIIASGKSGATTVASTMIFSKMAGIRLFATGGIGGVHRGAERTFDVSADLTELSHTDVAVVCAGVKSILDIGLTLEKLETFGVPVIGYDTDEFPSFYTRSSGFGVDCSVDNPLDCAKILKTKWDLNLDGGAIIANPVPKQFEADSSVIEEAIEKALYEANKTSIKGKNITPYLLSKIKELTIGQSLDTNIALVKSNVDVASRIAVEYASLVSNQK